MPSAFATDRQRSLNLIVPSVRSSRYDCATFAGRATDVEGTHRELRAGLADGLRRDDADRLADVDHLPRARSRP
jgi:hypothetical protein